MLSFSVVIDADRAVVWRVLTTPVGIRSYLAPDIHVVPEVGGAYEIYFDMELPLGQRGSEGMMVLAVEAEERFGFTWNNPPSLPSIRSQQTAVFIELKSIGSGTEVSFYHMGFGESDAWHKSYNYFKRAWGIIVLPRLIYATEIGPFPWEQEIDLSRYQSRITIEA